MHLQILMMMKVSKLGILKLMRKILMTTEIIGLDQLTTLVIRMMKIAVVFKELKHNLSS